VSPKQVVVIVDGGILSAILLVLTRYSANDPQFPVNDWSLFTGKSHEIGTSGTSAIRAKVRSAKRSSGYLLKEVSRQGKDSEDRAAGAAYAS
jgi:hypothetical protein